MDENVAFFGSILANMILGEVKGVPSPITYLQCLEEFTTIDVKAVQEAVEKAFEAEGMLDEDDMEQLRLIRERTEGAVH